MQIVVKFSPLFKLLHHAFITLSSDSWVMRPFPFHKGLDSPNNCLEMVCPNNWVPTIPPTPLPLESPYGYPLNFWPDESSLYNSALMYPPPLLDHNVSFSEPYLHQASQ